MSSAKRALFKSYNIDNDSVIVRITHPNELSLTGIVNVKSIHGCVEILGLKLNPYDSPVTVYSIKEYCALKVRLLPNDGYDSGQIESRLEELNIPANLSQEIFADFSAVSDHLLLVKKHLQLIEYATLFRFYELPVFIKENFDVPIENFIRAESDEIGIYQNVGKRNHYHEQYYEWNVLCDFIMSRENSKVVLCGGKGVGKSTLLRYLVNRCLKKWPKILVLDFDPGQSEFTVMGCLSAVLVEQPLLGPNFSHLIEPIRCLFLGVLSVEDSYNLYVNCVIRIINECRLSYGCDILWIVNTMGFVKGQGSNIIKTIIENVQPTDVVQIRSTNEHENFTCSLSSKHIKNSLFSNDSPLDYKLHSLISVPDNLTIPSGICGLNAATKRGVVSLFYFFPILNGEYGLWIPPPLKISLQQVDIVIEKPSKGSQISLTKSQKLCCLNGNLVALCLKEEENFLQCLGFGVIRGIDEEKDELYVITPLENDKLEKVDVIHMSSTIQLPDVVYKKQSQFMEGSIPFVTCKQNADHLNEPVKRTSSRIKHPRSL